MISGYWPHIASFDERKSFCVRVCRFFRFFLFLNAIFFYLGGFFGLIFRACVLFQFKQFFFIHLKIQYFVILPSPVLGYFFAYVAVSRLNIFACDYVIQFG